MKYRAYNIFCKKNAQTKEYWASRYLIRGKQSNEIDIIPTPVSLRKDNQKRLQIVAIQDNAILWIYSDKTWFLSLRLAETQKTILSKTQKCLI